MRRVLVVLLLALPAAAGDLSVDDLLDLRKAGFSDADIWKEVERAGRPEVTDADIERLKAAGFGDDFLGRLRGRAPLTLADIEAACARGESAATILRRLAATDARPPLTAADALRLKRAGANAALLRGLQGDPLSCKELARLAKGGNDAESLGALVDLIGTQLRADDAEAADLARAGVPAPLIKRLREGAAGAETWVRYEHPAGRFGVLHPPGWKMLVHVAPEDFTLEYLFTPETATDDPAQVAVGFGITPIPLPPGSPYEALGLRDIAARFMPLIRSEEPALELRYGTGFEEGRLGGADAVFFQLQGKLKDRPRGPHRIHAGVARKDGWLYIASTVAPVAEYEALLETFRRCADSARLGPAPLVPPAEKPTAQQWVERHKESVVLVVCSRGQAVQTGTGFVVREDGYVLTNHHVVFDARGGSFFDEIALHWDSALRRPPVKAKLVGASGTYFEQNRPAGTHGVDVALLKIAAAGAFRAMPLAPLERVQLSDPVLTMGFPLTGIFDFEQLSLFVTRGVVVRFNKDQLGRVDSLFIDAKITSGNSGGPCVDLEAGAVVGQNTFGFNIRTGLQDKAMEEELNKLTGYEGVIPIDYALAEFPDVLATEPGAAIDPFHLAVEMMGRRSMAAAERECARALERDPRHADAAVLFANCALRRGDVDAFRERAAAALRIKPAHYRALVMLAEFHATHGDLAQAEDLSERAVRARPLAYAPYLTRGALRLALGRHAQALEDADLALRHSLHLLPDPDVLAGEILFALGRTDDGRARMERARKIAPDHFEARMGVGRSYELAGAHEKAAQEYEAIAQRVPLAPEPDEALGRCRFALNRHDLAWESFNRCCVKCRKLRRAPSEAAYMALEQIAIDIRRDLQTGLRICVDHANWHVASATAHLRLARIHAGRSPGLAYAHALLAQRPAEVPAAPLQLVELQRMVDLGYRAPALAVARVAPLGFRLDARHLQGVTHPVLQQVLQVILDRQAQGNAGGPGGGTPPPAGPVAEGADVGPPLPAGQDSPPRPPSESHTWKEPNGLLTIAYPKSFSPMLEAVEGARRNGYAFVAFIAVDREHGMDFVVAAFDARVRRAADALRSLRDWQATLGCTMVAATEQATSHGKFAATDYSGTIGFRNGAVSVWEGRFVETPDGVRVISASASARAFEAGAAARRQLWENFDVKK